MKPQLRNDWALLSEIPETPQVTGTAVYRLPQRGRSAAKSSGAGSEDGKHRLCSQALWCLCRGATIAEAATHSGLTAEQVTLIHEQYGIKYLVANDKHQVDDHLQIGPWTDSRLCQSGYQRYKNDFHSWRYLFVLGLSVDEAVNALRTWPEFAGIRARLIQDYPHTWLRFAQVDIARCYTKFAAYAGPASVRKRTLKRVEMAIAALGKPSFKARELRGLGLSRRQIQRALAELACKGVLLKEGFKRGSSWETQGRTWEQADLMVGKTENQNT